MKPDYHNMPTLMLKEILQHYNNQYVKFLTDGESPDDYDRARLAILEIQEILRVREEKEGE